MSLVSRARGTEGGEARKLEFQGGSPKFSNRNRLEEDVAFVCEARFEPHTGRTSQFKLEEKFVFVSCEFQGVETNSRRLGNSPFTRNKYKFRRLMNKNRYGQGSPNDQNVMEDVGTDKAIHIQEALRSQRQLVFRPVQEEQDGKARFDRSMGKDARLIVGFLNRIAV